MLGDIETTLRDVWSATMDLWDWCTRCAIRYYHLHIKAHGRRVVCLVRRR